MSQAKSKKNSRREFVKKAAYIAPAIATLKAAPSFAQVGSEKLPKAPPPPAAETR